MRRLLCLVVLAVSALSSFAFAADSEITKIVNPTYSCGDDSGAMYINVTDKRVWIGAGDEEQGLEAKVEEFNVYRCPHCYRIKATVEFFGEVAAWDIGLSEQGGKVMLNASLKNPGAKKPEELSFECKLGK